MDRKQFEAGKTIMGLSRLFADSMEECLNNCGLLGNGYKLYVSIGTDTDTCVGIVRSSINLQTHDNRFPAQSFCMHKYLGEGWDVLREPERVQPDDSGAAETPD